MDTTTNPCDPFTPVRCVSDRYDADGGVYQDEANFRDMCKACFGEAPRLRAGADGWHDDIGLVLVAASA